MSDTKTVPTPIFSVGVRGNKMAETVNHEHEHIYTGDSGMNTLGTAALLGQLGGGKTDAATLAALSGGGLGGLGGGLLPLLLLMFLGRGRGGFLGDDCGNGCCSGLTTKDSLQQFQQWASTNSAQIAQQVSTLGASLGQQICCTSHEIEEAVQGLNVSMLQAFANQNTAMNAGFSQAQLQAATNAAVAQQTASVNQALLTQQINNIAAADALASCQLQNAIQTTSCATQNQMSTGFAQASRELAECCCDLKSQAADNTTRVLDALKQGRIDDLQAQLSDTKAALSNAQQTQALEEIIERRCRRCCIPTVPETVR